MFRFFILWQLVFFVSIFLSLLHPTVLFAQTATSAAQLSQLTLTEVVACPAQDQVEWLEVFWSGNTDLQMQNWKVVDASGNTRTITTTALSNDYTVISWTGSLLNNAGDSVSLYTDQSVLVFSATLGSCTSGQSFVWSNGQWITTTTITPGSANPQQNTTDESEASNSAELGESSQVLSPPTIILAQQTTAPTAATTSISAQKAVYPPYEPDYLTSIRATIREITQQRTQSLASASSSHISDQLKDQSSSDKNITDSPPLSELLDPNEKYAPDLYNAALSVILGGAVFLGFGSFLLYVELKRLTKKYQQHPPLSFPPESVVHALD